MKDEQVRIMLVEDEFITLDTLTKVLTEMNYAISGDAMSATEALVILEKGETDLAILDINIQGDKDGIWLAEQIREKYQIPFIFLTAFGNQSTVERAIRTEPYGYLVKPFNKVDVYTAIEVALKNFSKQHSPNPSKKAKSDSDEDAPLVIKDSIFIRDDYMFVKLKIENILFVHSDKNYLEIHLAEKRHLVRGKLSDFVDQLSSKKFIKVHRSYVVNIAAVDSFGAGFLKIQSREIPIGTGYRDELKEHFKMF